MATKHKRLSSDIPAELLEAVKDTVVWLQTGPERTTNLRTFVESAVTREIARIKRKHKKLLPGGEIPPRNGVGIRPGRRID